MKKWIVGVGIVVAVVFAIVAFEPSGVIRGRLRGEPFFQGRPATYWARCLLSDDPAVAEKTRAALASGGEASSQALLYLLTRRTGSDPADVSIRLAAAELLGKIGPSSKAGDALLLLLDDPQSHVRAVAVAAIPLVETPAERAVPALARMLDGEHAAVAARALSRYGAESAPAIQRLVDLMTNTTKDSEARWNAARTLGKIGPAGAIAVPDLVAVLHDPAETVREHAAEALGDLGPAAHSAAADLIPLLRDPVPKVRRDAARSLGQIGNAAPEVVEALRALSDDPEAMVKEAAAQALETLTKKSS